MMMVKAQLYIKGRSYRADELRSENMFNGRRSKVERTRIKNTKGARPFVILLK